MYILTEKLLEVHFYGLVILFFNTFIVDVLATIDIELPVGYPNPSSILIPASLVNNCQIVLIS
jgi:hypothetical protein